MDFNPVQDGMEQQFVMGHVRSISRVRYVYSMHVEGDDSMLFCTLSHTVRHI